MFAPLVIALVLPALAGCDRPGGPAQTDREALGTVVTVTAYGEDREAVGAATDAAFEAISQVERCLDAWSASSTIVSLDSRWATRPALTQPLPTDALAVLDRTRELDVERHFSSSLWALTRLYDFEGERHVPTPTEMDQALGWSFVEESGGGSFVRRDGRGGARSATITPGLDFGGSAKGMALDRAAAALRGSGAVDAALVTAGSTTVTFGEKPEGEPWRIGIEDPRDAGRVIAVVEASAAVAVSTSGDYQQYFERKGVRYHHVLDPSTGRPARGLRSLTVIGAIPGLDSDILSTALFVAGPATASSYAREHGLGLYIVDDEGRALVVPAPSDARFRIVEQEEPKP